MNFSVQNVSADLEAMKVWGAECSYIMGTCTTCKAHSQHALFLRGPGALRVSAPLAPTSAPSRVSDSLIKELKHCISPAKSTLSVTYRK